MSIDAIGIAPPAAVAQLEQALSNLVPPTQNQAATPTDPFALLLDAATSSDASPLSPPAATSAAIVTSGSVEPQLASLAGTTALGGIEEATAPGAPGSPGSSGASIVNAASQQLGVPYVWGGTTPSGFDCSGLVQYVFSQLGVALPRTAAEQEQSGTPVASLADAQPGDLLFFEPGQNGAPAGLAGHVAIYLGNGQMIDAPETGENVQVQQVPGQPLAIRRVAVPVASSDATSGSGATVEIGNVAVPAEYAGVVDQAASSTGTPAPLLAAILYTESRFDPTAVSSAGAEGIAQIMPTTAASNGINALDPNSAIPGAARLLAQYHAAFGSWSDAIAAYAAGGGAVASAGGPPADGTTPGYVANALALAGMGSGS